MFFLSRFLDLLFLIFLIFFKNGRFGDPFEIRWGPKWHQNPLSGAKMLKTDTTVASVSVSGFLNFCSISESIFNGVVVALCWFFVAFGIYANRFGMILLNNSVVIQSFWNRVRFSSLTQNTRSQISESAKICLNRLGVYQDSPSINQSIN